jgi:xylan 1,4-beta-xylosidase
MRRSPVRSTIVPAQKKCLCISLSRRLIGGFGQILTLLIFGLTCASQEESQSVHISVRADQLDGTLSPIWNFFGYDEGNYTYAPNGKKLLRELAALDSSPVYVRVHNLFTSGDGSASLKWGSTNVYTEDAAGNPVYSWTILDRIFDTFHETGVKPLVEIGFMPEALSTHPEPYRHNFPQNSVSTIYTGWAYPPKDYQKWSELVFHFVRHLRERYGDTEVKTWLWEVWNEPDIGYWQSTPDEYFKLYDFSADAVLRALPGARVGGPDSTGPANPKAAEFLRLFLDHCAHQKNYATAKTGAPLDFISYHPKGSPTWQGDHVEMGIARQLASIEQGFKIVRSLPEWRNTAVILGESDPEGCAACSAKDHPQNAYRNGPLYAAYTAEALFYTMALASREHIHLLGSITWAFEFEDQPPFEGLRELATNGIDKPVLNAFRMFGRLGNKRVELSSSATPSVQDVVDAGVRNQPDINGIATRKDREVAVLVWNYHDDDVSIPATTINLRVSGLPSEAKRGRLEHFRIDADHSNAFSIWKKLGSPKSLSEPQHEQLQNAGQLQNLRSPARIEIKNRTLNLQFALPRQGLSLLRLRW